VLSWNVKCQVGSFQKGKFKWIGMVSLGSYFLQFFFHVPVSLCYQQQLLPTALFLILCFINSSFSTLASFYPSGIHCKVLSALSFPEMCNILTVVGSSTHPPELWYFDSHSVRLSYAVDSRSADLLADTHLTLIPHSPA